jgi:hypothetical protein
MLPAGQHDVETPVAIKPESRAASSIQEARGDAPDVRQRAKDSVRERRQQDAVDPVRVEREGERATQIREHHEEREAGEKKKL